MFSFEFEAIKVPPYLLMKPLETVFLPREVNYLFSFNQIQGALNIYQCPMAGRLDLSTFEADAGSSGAAAAMTMS